MELIFSNNHKPVKKAQCVMLYTRTQEQVWNTSRKLTTRQVREYIWVQTKIILPSFLLLFRCNSIPETVFYQHLFHSQTNLLKWALSRQNEHWRNVCIGPDKFHIRIPNTLTRKVSAMNSKTRFLKWFLVHLNSECSFVWFHLVPGHQSHSR